jgi:hypothetical protein
VAHLAPYPPATPTFGTLGAWLRFATLVDAELAMSAERFAGRAGVKSDAIERSLAGKALSYRNRPKIEAALSELADYA